MEKTIKTRLAYIFGTDNVGVQGLFWTTAPFKLFIVDFLINFVAMFISKFVLRYIVYYVHLLEGYAWKHGVSYIMFNMDQERKDAFGEGLFEKAKATKAKSISWDEKDTQEFLLNNAIYFVILSLILVVIIAEPGFVSRIVFINILTQSSVRLILALGVGGIIILQGTDLSLGRSVGFAAIISGSLLQAADYGSRFYPNLPEWLTSVTFIYLLVPLLLAMFVSAFFSMINGFVVSVFKVHPFLATLGASVALYGILSMYFQSGAPGPQPIGGLDQVFSDFVIGRFSFLGMEIPKLIPYSMIVTVVIWFVWNKTTFGKNMFAVGGNPEAAKISGVSVVKTTVMVYILAGLLYGLGGYLEVARIGSASNATGINYELDAIAACVVGGISFSGGIGKISGAVAGVLMFTVISYGMNFLGVDVFYQYIVKGVIIVAAVALDTRKYIKKT